MNEAIAKIVREARADDDTFSAKWFTDEFYADRILALLDVELRMLLDVLNGERIEGWATNDITEWESWDFYADPVRPDGYCRATLIIHPEEE